MELARAQQMRGPNVEDVDAQKPTRFDMNLEMKQLQFDKE